MNKSDELLNKLQRQIKESGRDPDRSSVLSLDIYNITYPIRAKSLYLSYFKVLPNWLRLCRIKVRSASDWFVAKYGHETWNYHFTQIRDLDDSIEFRNECYCVYEDFLLQFDFPNEEVNLFFRNTSLESVNAIADEIDKALMRKGRLIARYEFRELETDLANNLSANLGYGRPFHSPALLTDIYN